MARGVDSSRVASRQVGNHSLKAAVHAEVQRHLSTFGTVVGTMDDGGVTDKRPAPSGGAPGSRPVFHGAHPNAIKLAQMQDNYHKAMTGLMVPPPDNSRTTEGLVDTGMGRLSDGVERPVRSWVDESIKKK
jgi:hypothetical protein